MKKEIAVIIPLYNHEMNVRQVVLDSLKLKLPVFVVDDGSTDKSVDKIKDIEGISLLHHPVNKGKGAAILTGFEAAVKNFSWAVTLDSDGQHNPIDALNMIDHIPEGSRPIVVGNRLGMKETAPWTSRFGRKFSNFWVWVSGGPRISDSQSGFRIYPIPECLALNVKARRFQFEVEILVKARNKNIPVIEVPVNVDYHPEGNRVSHFRPFIDFLRNSETFCRLIFQRLTGWSRK